MEKISVTWINEKGITVMKVHDRFYVDIDGEEVGFPSLPEAYEVAKANLSNRINEAQ